MTTTTATNSTPSAGERELEEFRERFVSDLAATAHAATVVLGDRLGLYRALAEGGSQTPSALASRTGCHSRLVAEWLNAQAASGYCRYEPSTDTYWLEPEHVACLVDEGGPAFLMPYVTIASTLHKDEERAAMAFTGEGSLSWADHHHGLYEAMARSAAADYADLVREWVPAVEGLEEVLRRGARVADVGCGEGAPTLLLAAAFPASTFAGFDIHAPSVAMARRAAAEAGLSDRTTFEVARADEIPGGYDVVCTFDALHDMGDPVAAARRVREVLAPGGVWVLVDRNAGDTVAENLHVLGRFSYSASSFICVPHALSDGAVDPLGAQAGEAQFRRVALDAGFSQVRRAAANPFNLVLEIRP